MALMGLSGAVLDMLMTPVPGVRLWADQKGSWFKVAHRYKCERCGTENRLTYEDKLQLFNHAQALEKGHDVSMRPRLLALEEAYRARGCTPREQQPEVLPTSTEKRGGRLRHAARRQTSEEQPYPVPPMPPVRLALELIKAGKEPSKVALEAVVSRRLAKWEKGALIITAAGVHAVADDDATREAMRSAQRPRLQ
jgi:hypothetical protein